ncbi:MAG: hypothetical protein IKR21_00590 [Oscillospiraceae bacterium]|nr:hypothetical protein [Oscillospiraceae bacterium]
MACFLAGAAEAVVVTAAAAVVRKSEIKKEAERLKKAPDAVIEEKAVIPWSRKLRWLSYLLWGGVILLAFEHLWHGEVVPWFPFLTAMGDPADTADMLHEISTVGVAMCALVTAVWGVVCAVADAIIRRSGKAAQEG